MKKKLTVQEYVVVASMLFGLFFGAGNLIFPVHMGQMAGSQLVPATLGFLITGVGLPLLSVAALGISKSEGLFDLSRKVSRPYAYFFTCLLYLTIGPFFAIPRCATTAFTVGIEQAVPQAAEQLRLWLLVFSAVFFAAALLFSLFPGKILTWVGKILNPFFLLFLGILIIVALVKPSAAISAVAPEGAYASQALSTGFLEGYNTMDVLAGLAFGIIVVQVIQGLGVKEPKDVAVSTVRSGIFSCLLMAVIYLAVAVVGTQSRGLFPAAENGGIALAQIAQHYLRGVGLLVLAATVTLACLKTSVALITSCSETFVGLFPKGPSYRVWAIVFCLMSFVFANLGLSTIISYAVPVLMFLYPLAIALILLALFGKFFGHSREVYVSTLVLTLVGAVYDLLRNLPENLRALLHLDGLIEAVGNVLPLSGIGFGWVCPAIIGLAIGLILHFSRRKKATA